MKYQSTRNSGLKLDSAQAIKIGIAPDGGLFVPVDIPKLTDEKIIKILERVKISGAIDEMEPKKALFEKIKSFYFIKK